MTYTILGVPAVRPVVESDKVGGVDGGPIFRVVCHLTSDMELRGSWERSESEAVARWNSEMLCASAKTGCDYTSELLTHIEELRLENGALRAGNEQMRVLLKMLSIPAVPSPFGVVQPAPALGVVPGSGGVVEDDIEEARRRG